MDFVSSILLLLSLTLCQNAVYGRRSSRRSTRPNIIFILMDDLDVELGSMQVMTKTRKMFQRHGAEFVNAFVTSPICCPSRSSILTGMYAHNHGCLTNTVNCASPSWRQGPEKDNFGRYLQQSGYKTGYFGKYLNNYDGTWIPNGWDNWSALLKNSKFYNYTLNRNRAFEKHGQSYAEDYFTDVVTNYSIDFFLKSKRKEPHRPVMMVVGMAAPHGPEDAAPQHQHLFKNVTAPRHPNFNVHSMDKHWIMRYTKPMDQQKIAFSDHLHRRRLLTLLSADDAIHRLYRNLEARGILDNTYIFLSSDHGYHLGQFGLAKGKSQPYETDIRIPFYALGPKVPKGKRIKDIVLNIDLAPTFLDIANAKIPGAMDGRSVMELLKSYTSKTNKFKWRETFLVEKSKKLYSSRFSPVKTKAQMINERCRLLSSSCKPNQEWTCVWRNGHQRLRKCRRAASISEPKTRLPRRTYQSSMASKSCRCSKKGRANSRRYYKRDVGERPRGYRWSGRSTQARKERTYLNYERHLKKESSASYRKREKIKKLEGELKRLKSKIKEWQQSLSRLRSMKRVLASSMQREPPEAKTRCRCVNGKRIEYEIVTLGEKRKTVSTNSKQVKKSGRSIKKLSKKGKKLMMRIKKKKACMARGLNCFLQTNDHWRTEPLWKNGSFCFCPTSSNNSFWCLRTINAKENYIYCEFVTSFCEFYDLNKDPYQLNNTITSLSDDFHASLHAQLEYLTSCQQSGGCDMYPGRKLPLMSRLPLEKACTNRKYIS